jgi:hypothetical protein
MQAWNDTQLSQVNSRLLAVRTKHCRACSSEVKIATTTSLQLSILSPLYTAFNHPTCNALFTRSDAQANLANGHLAHPNFPAQGRTISNSTHRTQNYLTQAILAIFDYFQTSTSIFRLKRHRANSSPSYCNTNTAKLTSTLLQRTGLTFAEGVKPSPPATAKSTSPSRLSGSSAGSMRRVPSRGEGVSETQTQPPVVQSAERKMSFPPAANKDKVKRRRRSSSLMYQEPPESLEQQSDQAVLPNLNAQWVNAKGM